MLRGVDTVFVAAARDHLRSSADLDEQPIVIRRSADPVQERANARDFIGRVNGRREFRIQVECVPVHLRQPEDLFGKLFQISSARMSTYSEWRGNSVLALKIFEPRM